MLPAGGGLTGAGAGFALTDAAGFALADGATDGEGFAAEAAADAEAFGETADGTPSTDADGAGFDFGAPLPAALAAATVFARRACSIKSSESDGQLGPLAEAKENPEIMRQLTRIRQLSANL